MSKFKPGQKVKVIASTAYTPHTPPYNESASMIGDVCEVNGRELTNREYKVWNKDKTSWWVFSESDLQAIEEKPIKKELKDMQVGDVLVVEKGDHKLVVVEVLNNCFIGINHYSGHGCLQSFKQAEENGWRLKDQPTPKKMTKSEIEERLGYLVEIVEE